MGSFSGAVMAKLWQRPPMAREPTSPSFGPASIVHEDRDVVVINKPAGLPTDRTRDPNRASLTDTVAAWRPSAEPLRAVHRLDALTSGLVILARSKRAAAELGTLFEARQITKVYAVWASGVPPEKRWRIESFLRHERGRTRAVRAGGKRAITEFAVIAQGRDVSVVEARPETGRTHQIRVQLADHGHPVVGDPLYAPPAVARQKERLMLHAQRLELQWRGELRRWEVLPDWPEPP